MPANTNPRSFFRMKDTGYRERNDPSDPVRREIRVGLLGCGKIGRTHAECLTRIPGARLAGCFDVDPDAARKVANECRGEYVAGKAEEIFRDDSVEAVYICTRHDSHAELAIRAARSGKHIFMEKPLALSLEECEAVAEAVEESAVFCMPGFKLRFYELIKKARDFIPDPFVLGAQMMDRRWPDGSWVQDPRQGGGNVLSQGCHSTDILRFLARSEPKRIWAAGGSMTHPSHSCIDQCAATIEFASGAVATWMQGDSGVGALTGKMCFQIFGGNDRAVQLYDRATKAAFSSGSKSWSEVFYEKEEFLAENREFVGALAEGRRPELSVYDAVQSMRMVLAAEAAIRTGEVQNLSAV